MRLKEQQTQSSLVAKSASYLSSHLLRCLPEREELSSRTMMTTKLLAERKTFVEIPFLSFSLLAQNGAAN